MSHSNLAPVWRVITSASSAAARWQSTRSARNNARWTDAEEGIVRKRRRESKTIADIAIETGRTWNSIATRTARLSPKDNPPPRWRPTVKDAEDIQKLRTAGRTRRESAKLYGITVGKLDNHFLHQRAHSYVRSRRSQITADEVARIVDLHRTQPRLTQAEIACQCERSLGSVARILTEIHEHNQQVPRRQTVVRNPFTSAEDAMVIDMRRTAKSLRMRYTHYLQDSVVGTTHLRQRHEFATTLRGASDHRPTVLQTDVPRSVRTYSTTASKASLVPLRPATVPYGTAYSKFEDNIILQRQREKKAIYIIASELSRSVRSVENRLYGHLNPRVKRSGPKLTDDQITEILCLKHAGIALSEIASQHQMSVGQLRAFLSIGRMYKSSKDNHCVGVCREEEQAQIVALRTKEKLSYPEIMRRTGRSYATVYRTLRSALDIRRDRPRPRFSATENAELRRLYEQEELTWKQVATRMSGRSRRSCENRYYEHVKDRGVAVATPVVDNITRPPQDVQLPSTTIRGTSDHRPTLLQTGVPPSMRTYSIVASKASTSRRCYSTIPPPGTYFSQAEDDIILQGRREKKPFGAIASELRTSVHSRVYTRLSQERRSRAMKFSDEQAVELMRSLDAGMTRRELATQYGIPVGQLRGFSYRRKIRLNRNGRNGAVCQDEDRALILAMRSEQGLTRGEISRRTGFADSTIARTLRRLAPCREDKLLRYSSAEDVQLRHLREHERLTWNEVAARMDGRTAESCKRRYTDYLKGFEATVARSVTERRVPYSSVEDIQLCHLREHERMTWKEVAARMEGRSPNSVEHRYNTSLKGREAAKTTSDADNKVT
ncbi:hypothetical protein LTR56_017544 [Elasticomyces elasticus]|nr:hypothetical protein LTR22_022404 [Elasticomyces elasticus]KAK3630256.1 hypothetical protein LTR56_017544 [Elasticomyces elasticus]KAK4913906.1 hypothetical protein LTR49_017832 [Elasticomyces elasticus]KAK5766367.1 hypothetical protein LTS12_003579 [Elasticomyces elasticus]